MVDFAALSRRAKAAQPEAVPTIHPMVAQLNAAAKLYDARTDSFAEGKAQTCRDIAAKLVRFGDFASDKQRDFADKLVSWTAPRLERTATAALYHPNIAKLLCSYPHGVRIGDVGIRLGKKGCYWVTVAGDLVGAHEGQNTKLFERKIADTHHTVPGVTKLLADIEADPKAALLAFGKASGVCGCCGLELTDPVSIERGIGPICAAKGGF